MLDQLPCQRGCCRCCIGPFAITINDVSDIRRGLADLHPTARQQLQTRARNQVTEIEAAFPRFKHSPFLDQWSDSDVDAVVRRFADRACPALSPEGHCEIYPFRPLTCRFMGIPVDQNGTVQGACEIQTFVPINRVSRSLREEEDRFAAQEQRQVDALRHTALLEGEELLLPFGFLPDRIFLQQSHNSF